MSRRFGIPILKYHRQRSILTLKVMEKLDKGKTGGFHPLDEFLHVGQEEEGITFSTVVLVGGEKENGNTSSIKCPTHVANDEPIPNQN